MNSHEIDYRIYGEEMQYVEIELDPNEGVIAEAGSFMMMDDGIKIHFWRRISKRSRLFTMFYTVNEMLVLHHLTQEKLCLSI